MRNNANHAPAFSHRSFSLMLALCLAFSLISCGNALSDRDTAGPRQSVSSASELNVAIKQAKPGTIIHVASGNYPTLSIKNIDFDSPVTIKSADEANPAQFEGFSIRSSSNIVLQNVAIRPPARGNGITRYGALILKSSDIVIDGVSLVGPDRAKKAPYISAIMLRLSSKVTVTRSYFANFRHGIGMLNLTGSHIALNEFEQLQTDGIRGGGVSDTRIENNVITNFSPAPKDHPDGIQLWSTNQKEPGRNIMIAENLIVRGQGDPIQGIFLRDTYSQLPFENVEIRRNMVLGGRYNGISMNGAHGVSIHENTVIGRSDQKSWIRLQRVSDARSFENVAQQFVSIDNAEEPQQASNSEVAAVDSGQARMIRDWIENSTGFAEYRGPVLRRLMAGD